MTENIYRPEQEATCASCGDCCAARGDKEIATLNAEVFRLRGERDEARARYKKYADVCIENVELRKRAEMAERYAAADCAIADMARERRKGERDNLRDELEALKKAARELASEVIANATEDEANRTTVRWHTSNANRLTRKLTGDDQ